MRDIRPNSINRRPPGLPAGLPPEPIPKELALRSAPPKRMSGASVPVTSVHVSKQAIAKTRPNNSATLPPLKKKSAQMPLVEAEFIPSREFQAAGGRKRPLFAKPNPENLPAKPVAMRVGHKERFILAGLFALILVALGIAGFIFLPKATIALSIQTAPLLVDQKLTIRSANTEEANVVPGAAFSRDVNVTASVPVTSKEVVGEKATGTVQIINRTTEEQKIKEKSRLATKDGTLFYMQKYVVVPAASDSSPSSASVSVIADLAGTQGNITPQRLNFVALDDGAKSLLYGESTTAFTSGSGSEVAVVKDADIEAAKKSAQDMAKNQAEQEIRAQMPKGWTILEESWNSSVSDFNSDAKVDTQVGTINFTANVSVRVLGYEESKFQKSLNDTLTAKLDKDFMLFPGPISFTKSVDSVDWDKGEGTVSVRVTHKTIPNFSVDALKDKLSALSQDEANKYLQGLEGVQSASIDLWPFWVHSIPSINQRVNISIKADH